VIKFRLYNDTLACIEKYIFKMCMRRKELYSKYNYTSKWQIDNQHYFVILLQRIIRACECSFQWQRYVIDDTNASIEVRSGNEQRHGGGSRNNAEHCAICK